MTYPEWKLVQKAMGMRPIYAVMRNPKTAPSKSHVRMSPEVFLTKDDAKKYIEESRRRSFLMNDQLVIVEMRIVGGELADKKGDIV
ncbi:MAG: hypothetical protein J6Q39_07120 [Bacteroidales bacterium]|nr:hypothetical protein [Bacteroidales bacterium]